jgi:hypothetical protein
MIGVLGAGVVAMSLASVEFHERIDPPPVRARASTRFTEAVEAFEAKDYATAAEAFAGANALVSHPNTMINLALALEQLGDLTGAWWVLTEASQRFSDEPRALKLANKELKNLATRTFMLRLQAAPDTLVCIDGVRIPEAAPGEYKMALPPGPHAIRVGPVELAVIGEAGAERVLGFERLEELLVPIERRYVAAMAASAASLAGLSAGLAIGAVATNASERTRAGLGYSAAILGAAATSTALALAVRARNPARQRRVSRESRELDPCVPFVDPELAGQRTGLQPAAGKSAEPSLDSPAP